MNWGVRMRQNKISIIQATGIFIMFTLYFFVLLFTLLPFLKSRFTVNSALYWFITGYFLFIPLFFLAFWMVKCEGNSSIKEMMDALNIKPFSKRDLDYSIIGLILVFVFTGVIFGSSFILNRYLGVRPLTTTPWFMEMHAFRGRERLLLLVWLPMFFFNIVGEEILWRGYIQSRLGGKLSWALCSFLWMMFHLPFGLDLMIMLIPVVLIVPYVFSKTRNTLTGIFIHGLYNGPIFVLVSLGFIK